LCIAGGKLIAEGNGIAFVYLMRRRLLGSN